MNKMVPLSLTTIVDRNSRKHLIVPEDIVTTADTPPLPIYIRLIHIQYGFSRSARKDSIKSVHRRLLIK